MNIKDMEKYVVRRNNITTLEFLSLRGYTDKELTDKTITGDNFKEVFDYTNPDTNEHETCIKRRLKCVIYSLEYKNLPIKIYATKEIEKGEIIKVECNSPLCYDEIELVDPWGKELCSSLEDIYCVCISKLDKNLDKLKKEYQEKQDFYQKEIGFYNKVIHGESIDYFKDR